jgi:hypothetical protein
MNTGIQDAFNLGWKLAAEVHGWAAPGLLDTYHAERHAVGATVLTITDAFNRLALSTTRFDLWLRQRVIRTALGVGPVRRRLVGRLTGIGIKYEHPAGTHPWTGRRLPDSGAHRQVYEAMRGGGFLLVHRGRAANADLDGWSDRLSMMELAPTPGVPEMLLLRPDGYVAWASDHADLAGLRQALAHWCGPIRPPSPEPRS